MFDDNLMTITFPITLTILLKKSAFHFLSRFDLQMYSNDEYIPDCN